VEGKESKEKRGKILSGGPSCQDSRVRGKAAKLLPTLGREEFWCFSRNQGHDREEAGS